LPPQAAGGAGGLGALLSGYLVRGGVSLPDPGRALGLLWQAAEDLPEAAQTGLLQALLPACARPDAAQRLLTGAPPALLRALSALLPPDAPAEGAGPRPPPPLDRRVAALVALARAPGNPPAAPAVAPAAAMPSPAALRRPNPLPPPGPARETAPLAVPEAGLVLLHPFLAAFFGRLGLLAGPGRLADAAARAQAVRAAVRLARGPGPVPEGDGALAKLLCGLSPTEALLPETDPPPDPDGTEGARLLSAVIAHWSGLGATTPAGLREGFLARPGALDFGGAGPVLRVERRGIDVLLDSLPWTIGHVRTPFMTGLLRVEWR
jgi:hypothetical protein